MPCSPISRTCRRSSPASSFPFHAQKGAPRYSHPGSRKVSRQSAAISILRSCGYSERFLVLIGCRSFFNRPIKAV
ncbi:MAG: hypothetical protein ACYTFI_27705, partial [Planctomycetota bacterium]